MTIGEKIKRLLKEKGMSQNELARRAGMSSSGMSTIITGAFEPRMDNLRQIAQVLGCQPGDLLDDDDAIKNAPEIPQDPQRASIIRDYDRMSPDQQRMVRRMMDALLED